MNLVKKKHTHKHLRSINGINLIWLLSTSSFCSSLIKLYNCLDDNKFNINLTFSSFKVNLTTALIRGESRKVRNGRPGHLLAIYMHTNYLTEHSLKLIQNFKEKKGWPRSTQPNSKSVHADVLEGTPVSAGEINIKFFFVSKINQNLLNFLSYLFSCVVSPAVFRTLKSVELSINFKRTQLSA